jgi:hypothetical protein
LQIPANRKIGVDSFFAGCENIEERNGVGRRADMTEEGGLKSAFDLAMERLAGKDGPLARLSQEQKKSIAEIAQKTKAKIAETEILFRDRIAKARAAGDEEKAKQAEEQMTAEINKLRAQEEEQKEKVRRAE